MQIEDIKKLAELARMDIPTDELEEIAHDFDSILAYVGQVQEVSTTADAALPQLLHNVVREDKVTNEVGKYTESIVAQMPDSHDGFLKVKQIL